MSNRANIAVLIPSYNPGSGLTDTLNSLRAQTVPYHLFIVDDGSPRKPDYAAELRGIPHTLIELPQNAGITAALNTGLREILKRDFAYIARMDCGDEMTPDRFAEQSAFLEAHPDVSIVGSWIKLVYTETGHELTLAWPIDHAAIARQMWRHMAFTHPAMMFRASAFRVLGEYSSLYDAAEDYELCRRAMRTGHRFHNIGKMLLVKTETRDSISWRKRRTQITNRLRIQWHYRDLTNVQCIKGLVKTVAILAVPDSLAPRLKSLLKNG
jgi:GT2 family glycosyltransferase